MQTGRQATHATYGLAYPLLLACLLLKQTDSRLTSRRAHRVGGRTGRRVASQAGRQTGGHACEQAVRQTGWPQGPLTYRVLSITHYETWAGRRPLPLPWLLLVHVLLLLPLPPLLQVLLLLPLPPSLLSTATAPSAATGTTAATAVATATALSGRCLPSPSRCSAQCSLVRACSRC
jgi:hypothetical protein